MRSRAAAVALGFGLLLTGAVHAEGSAADVSLRIGAGVDSNPLFVAGSERHGTYAVLGLDARVGADLGLRGRWFLEASADARRHAAGVANADRDTADLAFGFALAPSPVLDRRLVLSLGGHVESDRATFVDRFTGAIWTVPATDKKAVAGTPIPDRFDIDTAGLFARVRWNVGTRWSVRGAVRWDEIDYVEDYDGVKGLERLDRRRLRVEPSLVYRLTPSSAIDLALTHTRVRYVDRSIRGDGTTRVRLALRLEPAAGWSLDVGAGAGSRQAPTLSGRNDETRTAFVGVERRLGSRVRLGAVASFGDRDGDGEPVSDLPNGELAAAHARRLSGRLDIELRERIGLYASSGTRRTRSQDLSLAHDRSWIAAGIRFSH